MTIIKHPKMKNIGKDYNVTYIHIRDALGTLNIGIMALFYGYLLHIPINEIGQERMKYLKRVIYKK